MPGFFVTIEGVDGSGKTTVANMVAESLASMGLRVRKTMEPTRTWRGDAVRWAIGQDVDAITESLLFLADREAHGREIRAWLEAGELVLSDRYADSTYAYQGARLAAKRPNALEWLRDLSAPYVVPPDVTFFLAVPPDVALARIAGRQRKVRFEDLELLRAVDANYRILAREPRFVTVDATRGVGELAGEIGTYLLRRYRG